MTRTTGEPLQSTTNYIDFLTHSAKLVGNKVIDAHAGTCLQPSCGHEQLTADTCTLKIDYHCIHCLPIDRLPAATDIAVLTASSTSSFVLQGLAPAMAALTPCMRLYGFLGCKLHAMTPPMRSPYREWAAMYSRCA